MYFSGIFIISVAKYGSIQFFSATIHPDFTRFYGDLIFNPTLKALNQCILITSIMILIDYVSSKNQNIHGNYDILITSNSNGGNHK